MSDHLPPTDVARFRDAPEALRHQVRGIRAAAETYETALPRQRRARLDAVLEFLGGTLLPRCGGEERDLYPRLARRHPELAALLVRDHRAISTMTGEVSKLHGSLESPIALTPGQGHSPRRLLCSLHALVLLHLEKDQLVLAQLAPALAHCAGVRAPAAVGEV